MARAKASTWFNLVAGLVVGATAQPLFVRAAPDSASPGDTQSAPEAGRPHADSALGAAADAIRDGDYDAASALLQRAAAQPVDAGERSELRRLRDALNVAVQARRAGADQIRLAQEAAQQGDEASAPTTCCAASTPTRPTSPPRTGPGGTAVAKGSRPAPAAGDKPMPGGASVASPGGALATAQARAKLQQARSQMAQFNFERTEQLAHEAEHLQPKLSPTEDTPKKVLDDLARVRTDPKALLKAARVALGRKDYDRAEQFAHLSEKNSGPFTFPFWADSPSKVLKDVQTSARHTPAALPPRRPRRPRRLRPRAPKAAPANNSGIVTASATVPAATPVKPVASGPRQARPAARRPPNRP